MRQPLSSSWLHSELNVSACYRLCSQTAKRVARRAGRNASHNEGDIASNLLIKIMERKDIQERIDSITKEDGKLRFLERIAMNQLHDQWKHDGRAVLAALTEEEDLRSPNPVSVVEAQEDHLAGLAFLSELRRNLSKAPARVHDCDPFREMSAADVARQLGMTPGTVLQNRHRINETARRLSLGGMASLCRAYWLSRDQDGMLRLREGSIDVRPEDFLGFLGVQQDFDGLKSKYEIQGRAGRVHDISEAFVRLHAESKQDSYHVVMRPGKNRDVFEGFWNGQDDQKKPFAAPFAVFPRKMKRNLVRRLLEDMCLPWLNEYRGRAKPNSVPSHEEMRDHIGGILARQT